MKTPYFHKIQCQNKLLTIYQLHVRMILLIIIFMVSNINIMFVRIKKSGTYQYLLIVENFREGKSVRQRVIGTLGRLDELAGTRDIDSLIFM